MEKSVCFLVQFSSLLLSQWKHLRRIKGINLLFDPLPDEIIHSDETEVFRQISISDDESDPLHPR